MAIVVLRLAAQQCTVPVWCYIEYGDRCSEARTCFQLGKVATEVGQILNTTPDDLTQGEFTAPYLCGALLRECTLP